MENFTVYNETIDELPIIIDFPHSGTWLPDEVRKKVIPGRLLPNVDWFLPDLYNFLPQNGFTTLQNNVHRYVADPNRSLGMINPKGDYRYEVVYSKTLLISQFIRKHYHQMKFINGSKLFITLITISCKN
jgi:N-formylglutamate amidohydrolase